MLKLSSLLTASLITCLSGLLPAAAPTPPSETALSPVSDAAIEEQVDFILDRQLPSGALLKSDVIEPYAANTAAMGLLAADTPRSRAGALRWMQWNLAHLNDRAGANDYVTADGDIDGLWYTIYDHHVVNGVEVPKTPDDNRPVPYDSVDSYAATTLSVALAAYESGDPALRQFVTENIVTYEHIANLLTYGAPGGVRQDDGLVKAMARFSASLTMDNSEVFAGLRDLGQLELALGRTTGSYNYYDIWAGTSRAAITNHLWNDEMSRWNVGKRDPGEDAFYHRGLPQVFPNLFGVTAADDAHTTQAWASLEQRWPHWTTGEMSSCQPMTIVAASAVTAGRESEAQQLLSYYQGVYAADGWSYPSSCPQDTDKSFAWWHIGEAGWYLQTAVELAGDTRFTWDTATYPAGSGGNDHGTIGGGVWKTDRGYFLPTAGHVSTALGNEMKETLPGNGGSYTGNAYGKVAYSTRTGVGGSGPDTALVYTGTKAVAPLLRISATETAAPVTAIAHPSDLTNGTELCQSGTSRPTTDAGGYLCGTLTKDCQRSATNCTLTNADGVVNINDSGGAVWTRTETGIMLAGWIIAAYGTPAAHGYPNALFVPTWALQDHTWTATQAWTPGAENIPAFPAGEQTAGCFVTTSGCERID